MSIESPKSAADSAERPNECQQALELVLAKIIDQAQAAGWRQPECFNAVDALIVSFRRAYDEDPDPADDPIKVKEGLAEQP